MSDLTITRTVERWARQRWSHRLYGAGAWAVSLVVVAGAVALVMLTWLPWAGAALLLTPLAIGAIAFVAWRQTRGRLTVDEVAALVDEQAGTDGVLRTALAVEGGLASGGDEPSRVVVEAGGALLPHVEGYGAPPFEIPVVPALLASGALVLTMLLVVPVWLFASAPDAGSDPRIALEGSAFDEARMAALDEASKELRDLAAQPGVTPEAKAALLEARDRINSAMQAGADAQAAASELDRARAALEKAQLGALRSAEALRATRPAQLAQGLDRALAMNDMPSARRVGEEVLRRVDGGVEDRELRGIGQALAEGVQDDSRAGQDARDAGQALQAGDRTGALAALADLMAALGEPVRYEPADAALGDAEAAVEKARDQALERLDEAQRRARGEDPDEAEQTPEEAPGQTPSPIDAPAKGGQGDGGGGSAEGGTQDLREGGTPGAGQDEPKVGADAQSEQDRAVGPDGDAGRTVAGDGGASEGEVSPDEQGGMGSGPSPTDGAAPADSESGGPAMLVGAPGPAAGGGGGVGGGEFEVPLLDLDPSTIERDWVASQWDGAGEVMEGVVTDADAGGRSGLAWGEVHARYSALAESASRRGSVPLTRRSYVRRYFEAIRPEDDQESQ